MDLFIHTVKIPSQRTPLPRHLTSFARMKDYAWKTASVFGSLNDWDIFHRLNTVFHRQLSKYHANMKKRIIQSKDKSSFYRLLSKGVKNRADIPCLGFGDWATASTDNAKAKVLADTFELSYSKLSWLTPMAATSQFPSMPDSMWFHPNGILRMLSC